MGPPAPFPAARRTGRIPLTLREKLVKIGANESAIEDGFVGGWVALYAKGGRSLVSLWADNDGGVVSISNTQGHVLGQLVGEGGGRLYLHTGGEGFKPLVELTATESGDGAVRVYDVNGSERGKYPFAVWENHDISRWQFSRRGLLYGKLENGLTLICAHLGLLARERRYQIKRLQELIETHCGPDDPVIVAGDFNDWRMRGDRVMREQLGFSEVITEMKGRPARSFPAALPVLRVDRIYFRGLHLQSARLLRSGIWRRLSDHAAINADFLVDSQLLTYAVKTR